MEEVAFSISKLNVNKYRIMVKVGIELMIHIMVIPFSTLPPKAFACSYNQPVKDLYVGYFNQTYLFFTSYFPSIYSNYFLQLREFLTI